MSEDHVFIALPDDIEIIATKEQVKKGQSLSYSRNLVEEHRQTFAKQAKIPQAKSIDFKIDIVPFDDGLKISIKTDADLIRECNLTSEEFALPHHDRQEVKLLLPRTYQSYHERLDRDDEFAESQLDENDPELLEEKGVSLVSLALELLALNMDPYPKKPDATSNIFLNKEETSTKPADTHKPFANLSDLMQKKKNSPLN